MPMNFKLIGIVVGLTFLFYVFILVVYFIIYLPIKKYFRARKERLNTEYAMNEIDKTYPIKQAEKHEEIREQREKAMIEAKLNADAVAQYQKNKSKEEYKNGKSTKTSTREVSSKEESPGGSKAFEIRIKRNFISRLFHRNTNKRTGTNTGTDAGSNNFGNNEAQRQWLQSIPKPSGDELNRPENRSIEPDNNKTRPNNTDIRQNVRSKPKRKFF